MRERRITKRMRKKRGRMTRLNGSKEGERRITRGTKPS